MAYASDKGLLQNVLAAHVWFNISAANGSEDTADNRTRIEAHMTLEGIHEAQRRARVCIVSDYQDCD